MDTLTGFLGIKIGNRTFSFIFVLSKTQFLGFIDCVNMTYFLRGSDLLWAYSSFLCQVLPTLSSCGFSSFVPLPSFLLPTKWKQWLSKYTPPKTATILSFVTTITTTRLQQFLNIFPPVPFYRLPVYPF